MNRVRRLRSQRGTSTLEFIVVLPTLLLVLFAIAEISRAWLTGNMVTTAAREGARVGVVTPTGGGDTFNDAPALARITQVLAGANLTCAPLACTVTCATPCVPDSQVQANVGVQFSTLFPVFLPMMQSLFIGQIAIMRYE